MAGFIPDASAALPWCFEDEASQWTESLLNRLAGGEQIIVPAHSHDVIVVCPSWQPVRLQI